MAKIRITKEFTFEMAHVLDYHKGACNAIHGHSYKFEVTVIGEPNNKPSESNIGMVVDFGWLKTTVEDNIIKEFDHAFLLYEKSPFIKKIQDVKIKTFPFQPTCENMLIYFAEKLRHNLPENVKLFSLKLRETPTSFAEWYASDNEIN